MGSNAHEDTCGCGAPGHQRVGDVHQGLPARAVFGATEPAAGALLASGGSAHGEPPRIDWLQVPRIELEVAVVLAEPLAEGPMTADRVRAVTSAGRPGSLVAGERRARARIVGIGDVGLAFVPVDGLPPLPWRSHGATTWTRDRSSSSSRPPGCSRHSTSSPRRDPRRATRIGEQSPTSHADNLATGVKRLDPGKYAANAASTVSDCLGGGLTRTARSWAEDQAHRQWRVAQRCPEVEA